MNGAAAGALALYGAFWLSFGAVHSLLARAPVKRRLEPVLGSGYRLAYNLFALLNIAAVMAGGRYLLSDDPFAPMSSTVATIMLNVLVWAGILVMLLALRQYDLGRFSGLTQWRLGESKPPTMSTEPLNTRGLNRWVRHPLYTGAFLYLWGNAGSSFGLATAVLASAYLVIGARFEERQLISIYGDAYRRYQTIVPAFLPYR